MGKTRILIIDDDKSFAKLFKIKLERTGLAEVILAFSGDEGLTKVDKEDPDVIVLDIMMPRKNGYEVLQDLRKKSGTKRRPVIMLTSVDDLKSMGKAHDLEADLYLAKPFRTEDFLDAINAVLSLNPLWEEQNKKKGEDAQK